MAELCGQMYHHGRNKIARCSCSAHQRGRPQTAPVAIAPEPEAGTFNRALPFDEHAPVGLKRPQ